MELRRAEPVDGEDLQRFDSGGELRYTYDSQNLYLTAVDEAYETSLQRSTSYTTDFNTGLPTFRSDYTGLTQSFSWDDIGRRKVTQEGGTAGLLRRTSVTYEDANRRVITRSDRVNPGDQELVSVAVLDQVGRIRLSRQMENTSDSVDDDTKGIKVQTRYRSDGTANYQWVSNPYRAATATAGGEATMGWHVSTSDRNGRVVSVEAFDGATLPGPSGGLASTGKATTVYAGASVTVTDEAGDDGTGGAGKNCGCCGNGMRARR